MRRDGPRLRRTAPPSGAPWPDAEARTGPMRTCAGCGERAERRQLLRIGLVPGSHEVEWRPSGGRGTYLHDTEHCRQRFVLGRRRVSGLRAMVGRSERERLVARPS